MSNGCPKCGSNAYKKNGYTRHGKQNHRCLDCGKQFSKDIQKLIENESENSFYSNLDDDYIFKNYLKIVVKGS